MMKKLTSIFTFLFFLKISFAPPPPFDDKCLVDDAAQSLHVVDEHRSNQVPWFNIDLDAPAIERWRPIAAHYKQQINDIIKVVKGLIIPLLGEKFVKFLDWSLSDLDDRFPVEYAQELKGIAATSGVPLGEIVLYNVFYEIFSVCTSVVAQDADGKIYHARNMDFGLLMGWNASTHDWVVTEHLRTMVLNANFTRGGKTLYKAVMFAGYIGVYTGVKPNAFAVTVNERFKADGGYRGIYDWLLKRSRASWTSWMVRQVLENATSFGEAVGKLQSLEVIAPLYAIVSGTKPGEGQIIVRSRNKTDGVVKLDAESKDGWFLLQTNTDPWQEPSFFDNRTGPGHECMRKLRRDRVGLDALFRALSSPTVLNKLTVYTSLVSTSDDGALHTVLQKCPDPCWPW